MSVLIDDVEYYNISEACKYLGDISPQTLRVRTKALGIKRYRQEIAPNMVFYRKKDIEKMREMRPVAEDETVETTGE
jgi:hypothetical protein